MPLKIKQLPTNERPYEKFKMYGSEKLSNAELLAIIIKTGTRKESSIDIANRILLKIENLKDLNDLSIVDLMKINGIGEIKALELKAVCELSKRMNSCASINKIIIKEPKDVAKILYGEYKFEKQEILKVLILNTKNQIIRICDVVKGTSNVANVTMKDILAEPIKLQAPRIILSHNHPSGDSMPSDSDIKLTKSLIKASEMFGIELLDHIVIGDNNYKSIFSLGRTVKNELIKS